MPRSETFIQELYEEKKLHKEHRHKHVIYKLILTGSFFGLGQFTNYTKLFNLFLYIVPFVSLIHDIYICAEHYKVQRIGKFIKNLKKYISGAPVCDEEIEWEKFLRNHREDWAYKASIFYSFLITCFSVYAIYISKSKQFETFDYIWGLLCAILFVIVLLRAASMKIEITRLDQD